ncbi:Sodium-coupled monocarboxylate transporter 1 [Cichlidogyrus casuarinus]|uniref:Sodium-coupled monocarboxylate transporter 1 n=1 Tax=Cichlidogyrus casuarinus TaxID=1844966 RepID=A0ABD2Q8F7_9PLAT
MFLYLSVALFAPAFALKQILNTGIGGTIAISGIIATIYTAIGGIRAVVITDFIQAAIMVSSFIGISAYLVYQFGGFHVIFQVARNSRHLEESIEFVHLSHRHTFWNLAIGGTFFVLNLNATSLTHIQRYVSCKDQRTAQLSAILNFPLNSLFLLCQVILGLVTLTYFYGCDPVQLGSVSHPNGLLTALVLHSCDKVYLIKGIFVSCLFAAALSTISSGINSLALIVIEDFIPSKLLSRTETITPPKWCKFSFHLSQLISLILGLSCTSLAYLAQFASAHVLQLAMTLLGSLGGPIFATISIGISLPIVNNKVGPALFE